MNQTIANHSILILKHHILEEKNSPGINYNDIKTLKHWCRTGKIFKYFRYYDQVVFKDGNIPALKKAFLIGLPIYFISKQPPIIQYGNRLEASITIFFLIKRAIRSFIDMIHLPFFKTAHKKKISSLMKLINIKKTLPASGTPYYLRTDLIYDLNAGGSVGHIAGVLNNLEGVIGTPSVFLTSDWIPTIKEKIKCYKIYPEDKFWDYKEDPIFSYTNTFVKKTIPILKKKKPLFIYQRYCAGNFSGVQLAQTFNTPLVIEYNGSEVWISKNWGKPFSQENLYIKIEELNLKAAQLIVVVSQSLKEQLLERGINEEKILVNPNGVDPEKYSPAIDGTSIKNKLKLNDKIVIGFIGTFGKWHGAEILTRCFGKLLSQYKNKLHLLLIGDGDTMPQVIEIVKEYHMEDYVTLTGTIPQAKAPTYLAACDILAAPHIPNSDGSKFFGSPTKLFEYMAMGKGLIASDLDQIGEVLDHEKTAYLVKPGDKEALVKGLKVLIENPKLRATLGKNAREEVVKKYTWEEHTHKIIARLKKLCPPA